MGTRRFPRSVAFPRGKTRVETRAPGWTGCRRAAAAVLRGLCLCLVLLLAAAVTGAGLVNAEDACLDAGSDHEAAEAAPDHDLAAPDHQAGAGQSHGAARPEHRHDEGGGGQHALFHACCVHGGFSGLLTFEPKTVTRARLTCAFPRRPDISRESRALAPEPAPPRLRSA